jgi:hypothetical protein
MIKECGNCGGEFKTYKKNQLFCSRKCSSEFNRHERIIVECEFTGCTETFEVLKNSKRKKRFCSNECQHNWQKYNQIGVNNGNYGRENKWGKHSPEKRKEISKKIKKSWENPERLVKHLDFLNKHRLEDGSFDFQDELFRDRISKANIERLKNNPEYGAYNNCKKGWYKSLKTGDEEYYHSSWGNEKMIELDANDDVIFWTKKHGFVIEYYDGDIKKRYLPDFFINDGGEKVLEVKGYINDIENFKIKSEAALNFFKNKKIDYSVDFMGNKNKYKDLIEWFNNKKRKIWLK